MGSVGKESYSWGSGEVLGMNLKTGSGETESFLYFLYLDKHLF